MNTNKIIIASAIALTFSFSSVMNGFSHSAHDHSNLSLNWIFAKGTAEKVAMTLNSAHNTKVKDLSKFEQKKLDHYEIKVGNTFKSVIAGKPVQMKRTTTGIEIDKADQVSLASAWQIPLRKSNSIALASTGAHQHVGHDHSQLPYEWEFSIATENKIHSRISSGEKGGFVGLTQFEQKLMARYGIKVGNKINSLIDGQKILVERTSGEIRTLDSNDAFSVASSMETSRM